MNLRKNFTHSRTKFSHFKKRKINKQSTISVKVYIPYFRYYKTVLYLFLRLFGHSSRPRTLFFLASLELLVRLLFKGVLYSRASYNSGITVHQMNAEITCNLLRKLVLGFTSKDFEKLSFQEITPKFFDWTFLEFFLETSKNNDRNMPIVYNCRFPLPQLHKWRMSKGCQRSIY